MFGGGREGKDAGPGRIMEEWHGRGRRGRKAMGLGGTSEGRSGGEGNGGERGGGRTG